VVPLKFELVNSVATATLGYLSLAVQPYREWKQGKTVQLQINSKCTLIANEDSKQNITAAGIYNNSSSNY